MDRTTGIMDLGRSVRWLLPAAVDRPKDRHLYMYFVHLSKM